MFTQNSWNFLVKSMQNKVKANCRKYCRLTKPCRATIWLVIWQKPFCHLILRQTLSRDIAKDHDLTEHFVKECILSLVNSNLKFICLILGSLTSYIRRWSSHCHPLPESTCRSCGGSWSPWSFRAWAEFRRATRRRKETYQWWNIKMNSRKWPPSDHKWQYIRTQ